MSFNSEDKFPEVDEGSCRRDDFLLPFERFPSPSYHIPTMLEAFLEI